MYDYSYSGQHTLTETKVRVNALGEKIPITRFEGRFIWAVYAAPWCSACTSQAQVIKGIDGTLGERVIFLTIMTSDNTVQSEATQQTASNWASRFRLDPGRVLAADLWFMTIPTHILYSPKGQTLYRSKGYLPRDGIQATLSRYMQDWTDWEEKGEKAKWMKL